MASSGTDYVEYSETGRALKNRRRDLDHGLASKASWMERPFALERRRGAKVWKLVSNGPLIHMVLLTGKGVKDASSLAALLVHSRRPPSFSSDQVCSFVKRRSSLGADLVETFTCT